MKFDCHTFIFSIKVHIYIYICFFSLSLRNNCLLTFSQVMHNLLLVTSKPSELKLRSDSTWVGALKFLTCSRNDKNIKNLCISRAAATLFAGTLPIIQYKSVRESSYISQYDPNEDLSENIPNKFAIPPCFNIDVRDFFVAQLLTNYLFGVWVSAKVVSIYWQQRTLMIRLHEMHVTTVL